MTTLREGDLSHRLPWPLPVGQVLLYTARKRLFSWGDEEIVAQTLATGARKVLVKDAADARYLPTGHLVFLRRGVLLAVAFDVERLEVRGAPVPVFDPVAQALSAGNSGDITGAGQFAVSATGTMAWVSGPVLPYPPRTVVTVDHRGQPTPVPSPPESYQYQVRLSPDFRRLAVMVPTLTELGLWVLDLDRGTLTPVNRQGEAGWSVWSPDGRRLLFWLSVGGQAALAEQSADGTGPLRELAADQLYPSSFHPGGRELAAVRGRTRPENDIVSMSIGPTEPTLRALVATPAQEAWPEFSPDGRWLAYGSDASGRPEVYLRSYPVEGPTAQVSVGGGFSPAWRRDGRELFFIEAGQEVGRYRMMAVEFTPGVPPRIGRPRALFAFDNGTLSLACLPVRCYDVSADGQRFFATQSLPEPPPPPVTYINLILNWREELKAKGPSGTR